MSHKSSKKPDHPAKNHDAPQHPERFLNRELSWLAFNGRVLEEAKNTENPLLERLHYLCISAMNLDEFTMVRVAGMMDHVRHGSLHLSDDGLPPAVQLARMLERIGQVVSEQQALWRQLRIALAGENIHIVRGDDLTPAEREWLKGYFLENIFPVLTPIAIDPAHPFPFLPNLGIAQLFLLREGQKKERICIVPFPSKLARFTPLPAELHEKRHKAPQALRLIALEDIITLSHAILFPKSVTLESTLLRIVRDSDLDIDEEAEDLVRYFERAVKRRRRGRIIRIKMLAPLAPRLLPFILTQMQVESADIVQAQDMIGLSNLMELYAVARPDLKYPPHLVRFPERITHYHGDCFAAIEAKDLIVHHPFESFDVVVQFLRQAAADKDVVSIKQTLYRTSADSPIVQALIEAAEAGKSVTALVELKARFDEEANIKWARDLERAGAQVVFGFVHLKTHTKCSLVTRRVGEGLRSYLHFGTGNYHPTTARVYTDLSFFTCDPTLCRDGAQLFNYLTGYTPPTALAKLVVAPLGLRKALKRHIAEEMAFAALGKPAAIWAKMNALVDPEMIDALYEASNAGVTIELIVRGMCSLRPGVKGLSERIRVKSIVGRFLEHARIFCFGAGHGLPSPQAKVFLSSADWMPRNFDWRVEAMLPVENPTVHAQVLDQIMKSNIEDEKNAWLLQPDGSYLRPPGHAHGFSAHEYFMHNPSFSGRGSSA